MAFKSSSLLFVSLMVVAMAAAPMAEAQLGLVSGLLGLIKIDGLVRCSVNASTTKAPAFPSGRATAPPASVLQTGNYYSSDCDTNVQYLSCRCLVQLQCGSGNVVSSATTNGAGLFSIVLDPLQFLLSTLLTGCNLVVKTPLSTCDATLPGVGGLISSLQLIGNTLLGLLNIANIVPSGLIFFKTSDLDTQYIVVGIAYQ
ncbi:hypothetical protein C3L33_14859, partial [Rhododendron williamsianum]